MWTIHKLLNGVWRDYAPMPEDERRAREIYQEGYSLLKPGEGIRLYHDNELVEGVILNPESYSKVHGG